MAASPRPVAGSEEGIVDAARRRAEGEGSASLGVESTSDLILL